MYQGERQQRRVAMAVEDVAIGNKLLPIFDDPHSIYQCPDPTIVEDYPLCASDVKIGGQIFTTLTKTVDCPASGINKKKIACIIVSSSMVFNIY
ncbi:hypothetical protein GWI33_021422 [Rhynchophorus ferrugineus]|uniref:Uncharacterized protein n=1 Tax=Rhynchophorus ferrugineus TaxID=354439 RepID=A0A834ITR4_RHYFE|nr:hypothetical protein GWI33_021422 [Rhynchophorus ferrugineus]